MTAPFGDCSFAANTISVESSHNYVAMDISPSGRILITGNESKFRGHADVTFCLKYENYHLTFLLVGEVHVISLESKKLLHLLKVGESPIAIRFSPNGLYFAILKQHTGKSSHR